MSKLGRRRKWLGPTAVVLVGLAIALGYTALQLMANKDFKWPESTDEIPDWLNRTPNPAFILSAAISAIFSIVGAWAAYAQLFGPKPATETQVSEIGANVVDLGGQVWSEGQASEERDKAILAAVQTDRVGFTPEDIRAERISDQKAVELGEALVELLTETRPDLAADMIERIGRVTTRSAESDDPRMREVAALMAQGDYASAGQLQREIAATKDQAAAEPHRDAARILVLTDLRAAISEYHRATMLDPDDFWTWIELARLHRAAGSLKDQRRCAEQSLQHAPSDRERSVAQDELGEVETASGNLERARERYEAGHGIAERLAAQEPGNSEWQRDLWVSFNKLGDVETASGNLARARERYEAGLGIAERLAAQEPGNSEWQRDLSVSFNKLGDVEVATGNLARARERFEAGLGIRERLAAQEPGNSEWQRDLTVSFERLGDVERASGNLTRARERYEAGLGIRERLAAQEPGNSGWQRDLSVSFNKLGDVERASGNLARARERYKAGLGIAERLATQEPGNSEWQRDLSVSFNKLGDVERASGNLARARERYEAGLGIAERLAAQEPGNSEWQRDLFISHDRLARVAEAEGDRAGAIARFEAAEAIIAPLAAAKPDHPGFARDLEEVRTDLARLRAAV